MTSTCDVKIGILKKLSGCFGSTKKGAYGAFDKL
jgi:hypothetical protein